MKGDRTTSRHIFRLIPFILFASLLLAVPAEVAATADRDAVLDKIFHFTYEEPPGFAGQYALSMLAADPEIADLYLHTLAFEHGGSDYKAALAWALSQMKNDDWVKRLPNYLADSERMDLTTLSIFVRLALKKFREENVEPLIFLALENLHSASRKHPDIFAPILSAWRNWNPARAQASATFFLRKKDWGYPKAPESIGEYFTDAHRLEEDLDHGRFFGLSLFDPRPADFSAPLTEAQIIRFQAPAEAVTTTKSPEKEQPSSGSKTTTFFLIVLIMNAFFIAGFFVVRRHLHKESAKVLRYVLLASLILLQMLAIYTNKKRTETPESSTVRPSSEFEEQKSAGSYVIASRTFRNLSFHALPDEPYGRFEEWSAEKPAWEKRIIGIGGENLLGAAWAEEDTALGLAVRRLQEQHRDFQLRLINAGSLKNGIEEMERRFASLASEHPDAVVVFFSPSDFNTSDSTETNTTRARHLLSLIARHVRRTVVVLPASPAPDPLLRALCARLAEEAQSFGFLFIDAAAALGDAVMTDPSRATRIYADESHLAFTAQEILADSLMRPLRRALFAN